MPGVKKPKSITVRAYNVGFGDCFLLSFNYGSGDQKRVLIDFGTLKKPPGDKNTMEKVIKDIKSSCQKKGTTWIDAVVISHNHRDHISGFKRNLVSDVAVGLLVKPWTSDPAASSSDKKIMLTPPKRFSPKLYRALKHEELRNISQFAQNVLTEAAKPGSFSASARDRLKLFAAMAISENVEENTFKGVKDREYLRYGDKSKIEKLLPGVKVHVLGPPDVTQVKDILKKTAESSNEYWLRTAFWRYQAMSSLPLQNQPKLLFRNWNVAAQHESPKTRWFIRRMKSSRADEQEALLKIANDAVNNTSIILLFEVGDQKLLFSGDAQLEDWSYSLTKSDAKYLLKKVTLYKVGHHGSRNATPKSLWNLFENKGSSKSLATILSTLKGTSFGSKEKGTEIPRETLLRQLQNESKLFDTENLAGGEGKDAYKY